MCVCVGMFPSYKAIRPQPYLCCQSGGVVRWGNGLLDRKYKYYIQRNPVSKHKIQPEYGDEQADAGRDC